jgi:hypothetical protein
MPCSIKESMVIESKQWVGGNLIKAQYIHVWNVKAKPPWTINIYFKTMKDRRAKQG